MSPARPTTKAPRDISLDALKGLAITLVVASHSIPIAFRATQGGDGMVMVDAGYWLPATVASNLLFSIFYSFQMPLFAFVSGFVSWPPRPASTTSLLIRRGRTLLVPYVAWYIITFMIASVSVPIGDSLGNGMFQLLFGRPGEGSLWYLYALFFCAVVLILLQRLKSAWVIPVSGVLAVVGAVVIPPAVGEYVGLSKVLWIYPFFVLGYVAHQLRAGLLARRGWLFAGGMLAYLPLFYLRHPVHVPALQPVGSIAIAMHEAGLRGGFVLYSTVAYACAAAALAALGALYLGRDGALIRMQAWIGRRSLGVYAVHGVVLSLLVFAGVNGAGVLFVLAIVTSVLVTLGLERVPGLSQVLLGQKHLRGDATCEGPTSA